MKWKMSDFVSSRSQQPSAAVVPPCTERSACPVQWLVYFLLAIYLDNVLANESGVRQRPWYFLLPSYWGVGGRGSFRRKHRDGMMATTM